LHNGEVYCVLMEIKQTIKITFIQGVIGCNGVFYLNHALAEELLQRGYLVEVIAQEDSNDKFIEFPAGCRLVILRSRNMKHFFIKLVFHLMKSKPSAIFASSWPVSVVSALAARLSNPRGFVFGVEHVDFRTNLDISGEFTNRDKFLLRHVAKYLYLATTKVICVSVGVADGLRDTVGLKGDKLVVINNPIRYFRGGANDEGRLRSALDFWESGKIKLLSVGRLAKQKNYGLLMEALPLLSFRDDVRLLIVGEGSERYKLERQIKKYGLTRNIHLSGGFSDPSPLYRGADLFVMTSSSEGFGNVLIEALSFGLPIVSTDCLSGPSEILKDGTFGTLTPVNDPIALAEAITNSLSFAHDKVALRGRALEFMPSVITDKYLDLVGVDTNLNVAS